MSFISIRTMVPSTLDRLCIKHRYLYERLYGDALDGGFSTVESRKYAELEIQRLAEVGEIDSNISKIASEDDPIEVAVLSPNQNLSPLPPNPPEAPRKIGDLLPHLALPAPAAIPSEDKTDTKDVAPRYPFVKKPYVYRGGYPYDDMWEGWHGRMID